MPPSLFQQRLKALRSNRCNVLQLSEGLERLYSRTLPPRSIVLTFDDGYSDFASQALPALLKFGFPSTVYLTTYYSQLNRPVFNVMAAYLLWKTRERRLAWPEVLGPPIMLSASGRAITTNALKSFARRQRLTGVEKDEMLAELARRLDIDYEALRQSRILHLMTPEELKLTVREGVDIQLHTHRHRVPLDRNEFCREINENRKGISQVSDHRPVHFCYPNGVYQPHISGWVKELDIRSAVTCEPGLSSVQTSRMRLPRLSDSASLTMTEFMGWVSGEASLLPRRNLRAFDASPIEDEEQTDRQSTW
jgi:peptidoglycan/xylan/chitin deacetylase (PgdA/CDA1 family)